MGYHNERDRLEEMVDELFDIIDELTEWEYDFVNNMVELVADGRAFSEAQQASIEEIHSKNCN
jgi:hypothetical protein